MIDTYGREIRYLRLSVTDRCNLRCRYCMPAHGICKKKQEEILTEEEMICAVHAAVSLGIDKIRITGGEPLVRKNIVSICERIKAVEGVREVCMTTNGILLPQMAEPLRRAGVSRLNISLDTLDTKLYKEITRIGSLEQALSGIEAALHAGFEKIKINTVLIGGKNEQEIPRLAELTRRWPVDVRFIELMPMTDREAFGQEAYLSAEAVLAALPELEKLPEDGSVASLYHLSGAVGNIGLIRAVSAHFCASCNRIRLTADGKVKPCLHSEQEFSLKGCSQEEMRMQMQKAILAKPACHAPLSASERSMAGRSMNQIGG